MAWRPAIACLFVAAFVAASGHDAAANGRAPSTSTIHFRQGNESDIAIGLTFGLLISHDSGASWKWICEDAVGYKGMYDPVYVYTPQGSLFATTYDGYKVTRNGCTFDATSSGTKNVSASAQGSDGALYYAAAQLKDSTHEEDFAVYRSIDDGETFAKLPVSTQVKASWWQTLQVAPSDPARLYISGYFFEQVQENGKTVVYKRPLMFRSDNAGTSWTQLSTAGITVASSSQIDVVAISSTNPLDVFIRVEAEANSLAETIYRSTNGGASWTAIRHKEVPIYGFAVRKAMNGNGKHDWVLMTQNAGAEVSHNEGAQWEVLNNAPHANCLVENAAGELWACTQNYGFNGAPSDMAGIMKTTDLATWTKVLKYEDLTEAASCAAGTIQQDACVAMQWCGVCAQLSCHAAAMYNCPVPTEAPVTQPTKSDGGGCCQSGDSGTGAMALGLLLGTVLLRPRRRRG